EAKEAIILVGNPNVGKSLLFKNLTNRFVIVSNYPGTTVEVVRAEASFDGRTVQIVDTPGINDTIPRSDDVKVTLELLKDYPDGTIVQVADAKNLRRALLLTLQLAELGRPMILVLNMLDELATRGGHIDFDRLSEILGIPVVGTVAIRKQGTEDVVDAVPEARTPQLLEEYRGAADADGRFVSSKSRLVAVHKIIEDTYTIEKPRNASLQIRLGFWAMHPFKGVAFLAVVLFAVFWFVGLFGAGTLVDLLEVGVFEQRVSPVAIGAVDAILPFPHEHVKEVVTHDVGLPLTPIHDVTMMTLDREVTRPDYLIEEGATLTVVQHVFRFLHDLVVGPFGLITMALSYALAIVLPIVTTFFLVFSILEDSGYFPRMAVMVNRLFRLMGLNGKAVLPMILGLGCATMATMTTRILETRKERLVTIMLLALAVPCSAQLGVLLAMMAALSPGAAAVWVILVIGVLLLVGRLSSKIFGGDTSEFILEIPPMRRPQLANVLVKTGSRLNWYLREVIPIFVIGTAILFVLDRVDALDAIARTAEPLVTGWLGLPSEMANAFLIGFLRRDFGAVYILDAALGASPLLSPHQILVAMVTITLFMPCIANFLMIAREQGLKIAGSMAAFIFPFAFFVGGAVNHLGRWLLGI
ncbi:MAG: ferrous iron transporter B, partial [Rhodothermales bacterium]|nr:ferrous iron transporter B [Rhodothermales bacterium]